MKKSLFLNILYWISVLFLLTLIFGASWQSYLLAFYFSVLLLPIVILTTIFFNSFLVSKYLLTGMYQKFVLYFFYLLVVSLYAEMLVSLFSFVFIAKMSKEVVNLEGISIFILGITLYLIVFVTSFIRLAIKFQKKEHILNTLQTIKEENKPEILHVKADHKNHLIPLSELLYIESLNDYVKIITKENELITREKISSLSTKLPNQFIRVHRSFIVNSKKVTSFTNVKLEISNKKIPISRTYKKQTIEILKKLIFE